MPMPTTMEGESRRSAPREHPQQHHQQRAGEPTCEEARSPAPLLLGAAEKQAGAEKQAEAEAEGEASFAKWRRTRLEEGGGGEGEEEASKRSGAGEAREVQAARRWLTTEEYLPSSCSSSDAEGDDGSLNDESLLFDGGSSSSSSDLSVDDDGEFEFVEYYTGDEKGGRFVFLHMPPLPRDVVDDVAVAAKEEDEADEDEDDEIRSSIDEDEYREILHVGGRDRPARPPGDAARAPPNLAAGGGDSPSRARSIGPPPASSPRIPAELQAVFLASQRGEAVDRPPASGTAFRVFGRWLGGRGKAKSGSGRPRPESAAAQQRQKKKKPPAPPSAPSDQPRPPRGRVARFFRRQLSRRNRAAMPPPRRLPGIAEHGESVQDAGDAGGDGAGAAAAPAGSPGEPFGPAGGRALSGGAPSGARPAGGPGSAPGLLARAPSLRSSGSSRRGGAGSVRSASASAASSSLSPSREGDAPSRASSSRCPGASAGDGTEDGGDGSARTWESDVSDLSSEDEALCQDLEQMLSQAKAQWAPPPPRAVPAECAPHGFPRLHLERGDHRMGSPPDPTFAPPPTRSSGARLSSSQVNVYVPRASQGPQASSARESPRDISASKSTAACESPGCLYEPIVPAFGSSNTSGPPTKRSEPTFAVSAKKEVVNDPSATSKKAKGGEASTRPSAASTPAPRHPRIPMELQEIFLRSNAGEDVADILPPKNGIAFRVFKRPPSVWPAIRRRASRRSLIAPSSSKRRLSSRVLASVMVARGGSRRPRDGAAPIEPSQTGATSLNDSRSSCLSSLAASSAAPPVLARPSKRSEIRPGRAPLKEIEFAPPISPSDE
jgi:hypothetical protein